MPDYYCTSCQGKLGTESINIAEGVALCPSCGTLSRLSELIDNTPAKPEVVNNPPRGCTITDMVDKMRVRVSTRSVGGAAGLLFFCLFWNGIVSVFVLLAISGLYSNLVGPVPDSFPGPDMGEDPMGLGMSIFLCIFLIPFVTVGAIVFGALLLSLIGRVDIDIAPDKASVRTAIGPLGWTRRFDPRQAKKVMIGRSKIETNGEHKPLIEIQADRTVRFGSGLSEQKLEWLQAVLKSLLLGSGR